MKKIGFLFATVIMLVVFAFSASAATEGDYTFSVTNGEATITETSSSLSGDVVIPETLGGYPVTSIERVYYSKNITSVTIPKSVTSISTYAFSYCENLRSINVDADNTMYSSDSRGVLFNKSKTVLIKYPEGNEATSYSIPNSVSQISGWAFEYCNNLNDIIIPMSVAFIGEGTFRCCKNLKGITVDTENQNYTSDNRGVLFNKRKTDLIQYPIGSTAKTYSIPNTVTWISMYAFDSCDSLESIIIPDSVTWLRSSAFRACTNLSEIVLPDTLTEVESSVFYGTGYYNNSDNWENGLLYIGNHLVESKISTVSGSYTVRPGTKTIASAALMGCHGLTDIVIPDSVVSIGMQAFDGCDNLKSATLPAEITEINYHLFGGCINLESITIPESVTYINDNAFAGCKSLKSVIIPDSVTTIEENAFRNCTSLESISLSDNIKTIYRDVFYNTAYYNNSDNWENGALYIGNSLIAAKSDLTGTYKIKQGTKCVAEYVFNDCQNLKAITVPKSVAYISSDSFNVGLTIYYFGSQKEWQEIYINFDYQGQLKLTYHFNCCTENASYEHTFKSEITTPATHFEQGVMTYSCICGYSYSEAIAIIPHSYTSVVTPPTCTEKGYTTYTCSCSYSYIDNYVYPRHNYTSSITTPATHLTTGIKTYTCSACGDSYTETIPTTNDHSYTASTVVAPACEQKGHTVYVCECGAYYYDDITPAKGHNYEGNVCKDCGETKIENCSCNCHKGGIVGFFWKILRFFYKILGSNKICACGVAHY